MVLVSVPEGGVSPGRYSVKSKLPWERSIGPGSDGGPEVGEGGEDGVGNGPEHLTRRTSGT